MFLRISNLVLNLYRPLMGRYLRMSIFQHHKLCDTICLRNDGDPGRQGGRILFKVPGLKKKTFLLSNQERSFLVFYWFQCSLQLDYLTV